MSILYDSPVHSREAESLIAILRSRAVYQAKQTAYTFLHDDRALGADSLTYGELDLRARAIGAWLQHAGMAGERVLLLFPPGLDYIAAFFGCLYAKAVAVPAYPPRPNRGLDRVHGILADALPAAALTSEAILAQVKRDPAFASASMRWVTLSDIDNRWAAEWRDPEAEGRTLAFLQYTSGSTSSPKGVMVSHDNLLHNERMMQQAFQQDEQSVIVGWLPLFHDMGLIGNVIQPLYSGAACILLSPLAFLQEPVRWLETISQYKATTSGGPNFAYDQCVRKITAEQKRKLDLSSWTVAFNGSEPVQEETLNRFAGEFATCGFRREAFYPCYGLAEATLFVSGGDKMAGHVAGCFRRSALEQGRVVPCTAQDDDSRRLTSCGRPWPDQDVRFVDPSDLTPCAAGKVGEIWVAGKSVAQGYWNRRETEETFKAHLAGSQDTTYLRTGDLGFIDGQQLYITGRLKDLIIVRGRNHYPQDIERTVGECHPMLQAGEGAAFSVEADGEERLVVVQELKRTRRRKDLAGLVHAIRQAVAENHELQVHAVALIRPGTTLKTSSGKIRRQAMKESFLQKTLRSVLDWHASDSADTGIVAGSEVKGSIEEIRKWLADQVAAKSGVNREEIDPYLPVSRYGLDSLAAVELAHAIETSFGISISLTSFLDESSIADMAKQLAAHAGPEPATELAPAKPTGRREFPLSNGQASIWFLQHFAPNSSAYNIAAGAKIHGFLDAELLRMSFQLLIERHPSLRVTVRVSGEGPQHVVAEESLVSFRVEDAYAWSAEQLSETLHQESQLPFDLHTGPLFRVVLYRKSSQEHVLLLLVHHIVMDLWSMAVLFRELTLIFEAEISGQKAPLAISEGSYEDFVKWQQRMLAGADGQRLWEFWQEQLEGELPVLDLPADFPRPAVQSFKGSSESIHLGRDIAAGASALAQRENVTLFTLLLALYETLLHHLSGQHDFVIGTPSGGRYSARFDSVVGYFVNSIPIRTQISGAITFREFLAKTRRAVLEAFEHQQYPFGLMVDRLRLDRDLGHSPIFQTMFVLQKVPSLGNQSLASFALGHAGATIRLGPLALESIKLDQQTSKFDLTLAAAPLQDGLALSIQYSTELFSATTIKKMLAQFSRLLEAVCADPDCLISELPLLTKPEARQPDQKPRLSDGELSVVQRFELQAERSPEAIAVRFRRASLTYAEVNRKANQLSHYLREHGIGPEKLVGICAERSPDMIIAVLGVLKAGGAYVPLDPGSPADRLGYMAEDAGISVLLSDVRMKQHFPASLPVISIGGTWAEIATYLDSRPAATAIPTESLAYVLYTSGSTGRPKGVGVEHRQLAHYVQAIVERIGHEPCSFAMVQPLAVDSSVTALFLPLCTGGAVHMVTSDEALDAQAMHEIFQENDIAGLKIAPSHLAALHASLGPKSNDVMPKSVLIVGGEASRWSWLCELQKRAPECKVFNHYGPTETTVGVTAYRFGEEAEGCTYQGSPLGAPLGDTRLYLLNDAFAPLPDGARAELFIGGPGVSRGYLNRPDLTAEKFVPDPFSGEPGARMYRTGDRVRRLIDGNVEFLDRFDEQMKIRGYRIKPGEIESAILKDDSIREAAVALRSTPAGLQRLVAYVVYNSHCEPDCEQLRNRIQKLLPEYMVPNVFMVLKQLPRSSHGKLDRKNLPDPEWTSESRRRDAPTSAVQEILCAIWKRVLKTNVVGIHDNFFELGGQSLLAMQLVSRIREELQVTLEVRALFEAPTVAELAARIEKEQNVKGQAAGAHRQDVPVEWNSREKKYDSASVVELFARQAVQTPTALAVVCGHEHLTYQQLDSTANQLASYLRKRGVGPEKLVCVCTERSLEMVIGILGVLKAGGAYVPIDPNLPSERIEWILQDCRPQLIVTQERLKKKFSSRTDDVLCIDAPEQAWSRESVEKPEFLPAQGSAAYAIYTSGSTGRPKAVVIEHRQLANYVAAIVDELQLKTGSNLALVSTFAADLGNTMLYPSLCFGGTLHVVAEELCREGRELARYFAQHRIDYVKITPSHISALANVAGADVLPAKAVVLGGESCTWSLIRKLAGLTPQCEIFNHYGPTEATVGCVAGKVDVETRHLDQGNIPLGQPLGNMQVYILDEMGEPAPLAMPGELYIGGAGVGRGYLNQPEQTAEKFVPNPFTDVQGARLYRTGDCGRWRRDGKLEFLGRYDRQVKIRGYRVELEEIENALLESGSLQHAIVSAHEDIDGNRQLVAYVVRKAGVQSHPAKELSDYLLQNLPEYMVPSTYIELEKLPLTSNGKVDRNALPVPQPSWMDPSKFDRANTPESEALCEIFAELLRLPFVGEDENFFQLGGHSLLAMQAVTRIHERLNVEVPVRTLFEAPTAAALVSKIAHEVHTATATVIRPLERTGEMPLSYAQQRMWVLEQLTPGSSAYNMPARLSLGGRLNPAALEQVFSEIARRHEVLRACFPPAQDGQPRLEIRQPEAGRLPVVDLTRIEEGKRQEVAQQIATAEAHRLFSLARGPLMRTTLVKLGSETHLVLHNMHHIVSDGWSNGVLVREVSSLYESFRNGRPSALPELPVQYVDYAGWQRQRLQGETLEAELSYWREQLAEAPPVLELPTDRSRPAVQTFSGARAELSLPQELTGKLEKLSRREGSTLFMTLLAAFNTLLYRYTGQDDVVVGTNVAGRNVAEIENLIG
ncbi:MAG: amino acid adenylation domain-containing protein, partial [Candidatus Angelobacter sp.]